MDINKINIINSLAPIISLIIGYCLGSIPNGIIISKLVSGKDPRKFGSGNSGGTNVGRMLGKRFGLLVILLDMGKTALSVYIAWALVTFIPVFNEALSSVSFCNGTVNMLGFTYWIAALGATIGHCWSPWLHFRGGKAAGNMMGMTTMTSWFGFLIGGIYLGTLKFKKMVSLSSIIGGAAQVIGGWIIAILVMTGSFKNAYILSYTCFLGDKAVTIDLWYAIITTIIEIILIFRHASNIVRMKKGTESHITWMH